MRIKLELDEETRDALLHAAVQERRPVTLEAEVLLRRALGLDRCDCVCHVLAEPGRRDE